MFAKIVSSLVFGILVTLPAFAETPVDAHITKIDEKLATLIAANQEQAAATDGEKSAADLMAVFVSPIKEKTKEKLEALNKVNRLSSEVVLKYSPILRRIETDYANVDQKISELAKEMLYRNDFYHITKKPLGDIEASSILDKTLKRKNYSTEADRQAQVAANLSKNLNEMFQETKANRAACPSPERARKWRTSLTEDLANARNAYTARQKSHLGTTERLETTQSELDAVNREIKLKEQSISGKDNDEKAISDKLLPLLKEIVIIRSPVGSEVPSSQISHFIEEKYNDIAKRLMNVGEKWNSYSFNSLFGYAAVQDPDSFVQVGEPGSSGRYNLSAMEGLFGKVDDASPTGLRVVYTKVAAGRLNAIDELMKTWSTSGVPATRMRIGELTAKKSDLQRTLEAGRSEREAGDSVGLAQIDKLSRLLNSVEKCLSSMSAADKAILDIDPTTLPPHAVKEAVEASRKSVTHSEAAAKDVRAYNRDR